MRIIIETDEQPVSSSGISLPTTVDRENTLAGGEPSAALMQAVGRPGPSPVAPVTANEAINAGAAPEQLVRLLHQLGPAGREENRTDNDGGSAPNDAGM
jgi:hypothetical protein